MKCMSGAAGPGFGIVTAVIIFSLVMLCAPPIGADPDVAGGVQFSASEFFTDSTAYVYVNDADLNTDPGTAEQATVTVNSTADPAGITVTLVETGTDTGNFSGNFTFIYNSSSDDSNEMLNVTDRSNVTVQYTDASPSAILINETMFNYTINATIFMNASIFGLADTVNVTMCDNDTNTNSSAPGFIYIGVTSPSGTNITVALNETGNNTGCFEGNFTFGAASDNASRVLGISEGDVIAIYMTDSLNSYGNPVVRTNTSMMARNATIAFDNISYYPASAAVITVSDNDTAINTNASLAENVTVNITSNSDPAGINVTLTETGNNTGVFNGTFTLVESGASNDTSDMLNVTDGDTITAAYTDATNGTGGSNARITNNTPTYYYRVGGSLSLDLSAYGPNSTANIMLNDSDLNTNTGVAEQVTVLVNSSTNATGINVILGETGVSTGIFDGTFTFSVSGNTSNANDIINASHNDQVTVIYNDTANSSGHFAVVTANATFYSSLNAVIGSNGTYLNSTYIVLPANATVLLNLTDMDSYANTDTGAADTANITIANMDTGCEISITLNETGNNTGIFNGTFNLSETSCNNSLGVMNFTAGGEDWLDINYTDPRNGTADTNVTANYRVLADDRAPVFSGVSSPDADTIYTPGEMINITVELDQTGGNLSVNFSVVDSAYATGAENVTDYGNGTYKINYTISSGTTVEQGRYALNITAYDGAGNGPAYDASLSVTLSKLGANETLLNFTSIAPRGSFNVNFTVSNDGGAQALITETITAYKEYLFDYDTGGNESHTFYFLVPENSSSLRWSVGSNETWAVLSQTLYDHGKNNQSGSLTGSKGVSVSAGRAEVWHMVVSASNISSSGASITPRVSVYFNTPGWFNSSVTSGTENLTANSNKTISINLTIPFRGVMAGMFNGTVVYNNSNASVSVPFIFNITSPEQRYESNASSPVSVLPDGTVTLNVNLNRGVRTLEILINNTGNQNLTGVWANLTSGTSAETNLSLNTSTGINISAVSGSAGSGVSNRHNMTFIPVAENSSAWLRLSFNTSEHTSEGVYSASLAVYSVNGQPYNESILTLRVNLTRMLNVTVYNASYNGSSPALPRPGRNMTVNATVRYQDGDPVAGLALGNFSIYDTWTTGSGAIANRTSGNLGIHDFSKNGSGIYIFNYTVPALASGRAEHGMHRIVLEAWASDNNIGNGSGTYNMSAPNIDMSFNSFYPSLNNGSTDAFSISIINNGTAAIYNVSLNLSQNSSCTTLNVTSCPIIGNITAGENATACSVLVTAGSSACTENITFKAGGVSIFGTEYNATQTSKTIDVVVSGSSSSTSSSGGTTASTCSSDSDCSVLYYCNATSYCERIVCPYGYIEDHKCLEYSYGLEILSYEPSVYVLLGSSGSALVNVNNTKNTTTVKAELELSTITGSVEPSEKVITSHQNYTFNVTVSAPNETSIGNYSVTFRVYRSSNSSIYDSASFTVVVMPHEGRIGDINIRYENYSLVVEGLESELEGIRAGGFVSPGNFTVAERLVNTTRAVLDEIGAAISEGDYARAESLLDDLRTYMNDARNALDSLKLEQGRGLEEAQGGLIVWIVIGAVVAAAACLIVYMFLPPKGPPGYRVPRGVPKPGILNKITRTLGGRFRRRPGHVAGRLKEYAKGYEKQRGLGYKYKEGIVGRARKLFRGRK